MAVTVETEPTLKLGKPETVIQGGYSPGISDIHPDGRFLMVKQLTPLERSDDESQAEDLRQQISRKIIVVTNWFEELKDRVPVE